MRRLIMLGLAVAACSPAATPSPVAVRPGMTEQQVIEANRVPDQVIERICGSETPAPFPCRIYVYEAVRRDSRYQPKLSVVFEQARGRWLVTQWL
jgi:hypothetical protein